MDEAKLHEIRAWLAKASQDLGSAEWLLASPKPFYSTVGFHCQQAAEKTIKAYLTWRDEPFEKTHSLVALVHRGGNKSGVTALARSVTWRLDLTPDAGHGPAPSKKWT